MNGSELAGSILIVFPINRKREYLMFKYLETHPPKKPTWATLSLQSHSNTEKVGSKVGYLLGRSSGFLTKSWKYVRFSGRECGGKV